MRRSQRRLRRRRRAAGLRRVKRAGRRSVGAAGAFLCAVLGHGAFTATFSAKDEQQSRSLLRDAADGQPDGRFLVFGADRALRAVDARGAGPARMYEYDAQSGAQDFYEYREGGVYLLAGVTSESGEMRTTVFGGGVSGSDVFFSTFEAFVPEDTGAELGCYDAGVCGEGAQAGGGHEQCLAAVVAVSPCGEGGAYGAGQSMAMTVTGNRRAK